MNKFSLTIITLCLFASIAGAQEAVSTPTASPSATSRSTRNTNSTAAPSPSANAGETATADTVTITSEELDISREAIVPNLGATRYTIGPDRIDSQSQGANAPFNETILRFPGVSRDSFGQLHVRGEHGNLQYRIDDVLVPESIPGFGPELATRFADNISLMTGALPAQFGFRQTAVIDIHTKSGAAFSGNEAAIEVGSFDTFQESLERGGVTGRLSYYVMQSYFHSGIGVENPTRSDHPIHDDTDQFKEFAYASYIIDDTSRFSLLVGDDHNDFQIPNNPGQMPAFTLGTRSTFNSAKLNENQSEDNQYDILTYQKKVDDFNFQISAFNRYSSILFRPDNVGDLIFNGVASRVDRDIQSNGLEFDSSYKLNDEHTIRAGGIFTEQYATVDTVTLVFPGFIDSMGVPQQTSTVPRRIVDNNSKTGYFYGFYLQDEWKPLEQLTINYGARLDFVNAFVDENQLSPRVNVVYKPWDGTALHAGYARYFTPPPLEAVPQSTISKFANTTNQSAITKNSPTSSERAHYFDIGITQKILEGWNVGLDGFYKSSHSTIDEGQFGQALILSSFNYKRGRIYGGELTTNYDHGPFSLYGNAAYEWARGTHWSSAQFLFDPTEYKFVKNHWVFLDHDQRWTATAGGAYTWNDWRLSSEFLYGSGLRRGFANTKSVPDYGTVNLGLQRIVKIPKWPGSFKVRLDIMNLFDKIYELRDGSGIGVGAPQFGQRRGFYGTVAYDF
ncbi:MAG TPA: TonB-dependent receptor [Chthoniobacterales bacterium]|jgi:outer membrane receptor protein involved in Fe transport|nr:TonB-dependent receptor [Chthoniobacterales bacterium]